MSSSKELPPLKVSFGDTFEISPQYLRPSGYVAEIVVELTNRSCIASPIYLINDREVIDPTCRGTAGREHIVKITGRWELERMLEAVKRGCCNGSIADQWEELRQDLTEASKTSAIILT